MLATRRHSTLEPKRSFPLAPVPAASRPHGGRTLDAATLDVMESRFNEDFSDLRIHTDEDAERLAAALGTRAFSSGPDVMFGRGQYSPATPGGQRLLAHELAHVAQQRHGNDDASAGGSGGESEARAETAAQHVARGHRVNAAALGGAVPGIHRDGGGKDEKKEAPAPKIEARPFFLPWSMLPLPQLKPPSLLAPPERQPIFPLPQFSTGLGQGTAPPGAGLGFGSGSSVGQPPLFPPLLPGTAGGGPLAPTSQPLPPLALPSGKGGGASPDLPSRIGVVDAGPINFGLRMGMPGPQKAIEGTPPERRPQPPFQIPGSGPSALSVSEYQAELLDLSITGKVPTGFDAVDKGALAKILFSIASTYIAPDFFKSLASKVAGKPGADYQIDFSLSGDFKGGGLVFTMPLGKPPKIAPRSSAP